MRKQRLENIQNALYQKGLDGLYLGRADRFQGEEVRACDEFLAFVSGFTGSAGALVMLGSKSAVFSDSRYSLQMQKQLNPACFECFDTANVTPFEWIETHNPSAKIGFDGWQLSTASFKRMQKRLPKAELIPLDEGFLAAFWEDRPACVDAPIWWPPLEVVGQKSLDKIAQYKRELAKNNAEFALITSAESVNWLLNMRGRDLEHTPVKLCYALISKAGDVHLIGADTSVEQFGYHSIAFDEINVLFDKAGIAKGCKISCDPETLPYRLFQVLDSKGADIDLRAEPIITQKAVKNTTELEGFRAAHLLDGLAMVEFSYWLKNEADLASLHESDIAAYLTQIRAKASRYICDSFATISGFNANGAIVHYRAIKGQDSKLGKDGVLLVDSGAHYEMGTTDITRCFGFGKISEKAIKAASIVLGGHADLAMARFPSGTNGIQLDTITRAYLWQAGYDYGHGTGHGVGHMLGVHEGPISLSKRGSVALLQGHILSNEPGYYLAGEFGIRHENLVYTTSLEDGFLGFETLTLCPFDRALIDKQYLSTAQLDWINQYHQHVYEILSPHLTEPLKHWLEGQTTPL